MRVERAKFRENLPTNERRCQEVDGGAGDKRHEQKTKRRRDYRREKLKRNKRIGAIEK